jgi:4'-phosphopantetheinyl transferase EntD
LAQNLVFCAKEAVFKCQYPLTGERDLDFHEVQLTASIVPNALAVACSARNSGLAAGLTGILLFMFSIQGLRIIVAIAPAARAEMIV